MNFAYRQQAGWRLVVPPTTTVFDLDDAKSHIKIDGDAEDLDIQALIDTAVGYIEARDHYLAPQTWELTLDRFPVCGPIALLKAPILSIDAIEYVDSNGATQTWNASEYQVALKSFPARIAPVSGSSWPTTKCQMEAVAITVTLGYNNSPVSIPSQLSSAMKLLVGHLYANREAVVIMQGIVSLELPLGLEALIDSAIGRARVY